jgi:glucuronate isomerase
MPKPFLSEDFLLETETARILYHEYARKMPIIDYHCHLPPDEIAADVQFENLTRIWLKGDHYKWRAMRTNGVDERYITGNADDYAKFEKWAETVPYTLRNPLYHWTHMELKRPFGVEKVLDKSTAREIYDECSAKLQTPAYRVRGILRQMNVQVICTTDDPTDTLEHHRQLQTEGFPIKVYPTYRPDKAMAPENPAAFRAYVDKLAAVAKQDITTYDDYLSALQKRHDFFAAMGCRLSDHGLETMYAEEYTGNEIQIIFGKARSGQALSPAEILKFKSAMLVEFARMDHAKGWTQQFHLGALRNNNSRMLRQLGPDTGWDSIGDFEMARPMARFFDRLDAENKLAKTIIYNLNPRDNELFATMIGNFNDGSVAGKVQFGSGWWFLDQKDGMIRQLNALSNMGLLSRFVGMVTDSRSFLSYPRHEYFRRILCNLFGNDVENGELPNDTAWIGKRVEDICYTNAREYFGFAG